MRSCLGKHTTYNDNVEVTSNQNEKKISQIPRQNGTGNRSSRFTYHITILNMLKIFTLNPHGSQIVQSREIAGMQTRKSSRRKHTYIQHIHFVEASSIRNIIKYNNCNYIKYIQIQIHTQQQCTNTFSTVIVITLIDFFSTLGDLERHINLHNTRSQGI